MSQKFILWNIFLVKTKEFWENSMIFLIIQLESLKLGQPEQRKARTNVLKCIAELTKNHKLISIKQKLPIRLRLQIDLRKLEPNFLMEFKCLN